MMKFKSLITVGIVSAAITLTGCKKFLDVNTNPNTATVTNPQLVFTNAQNVHAAAIAGTANILGAYWAGYWAHSTSFTTGTPEKTYNFTNGDFDYWSGIYDNLYDFQTVINSASAAGVPYLIGPSKIIMAMRFQTLVDLYGNVPYTDAFKGLGSVQPKYDSAQTIYEALIPLLTDAIANIKANPLPSGLVGDIYWKGSNSSWIKMANTVKMRILMRQANITGRSTYITTQIAAIVSEGSGFLDAGQTVYAQPGYTKTSGKLNPFYSLVGYDQNDAQAGGRQLYRISKYLIDTLKTSLDTFRLKYIADVIPSKKPSGLDFYLGNATTDYVGVPFGGEGSAYVEGNTSPIGPGRVIRAVTATSAQPIMTAAESYFLRAEAAQRYGLTTLGGTAKSLYESGVRESFSLLTVTSAFPTAATTLLAGSASFDNAADKLKAIIYQKWVALANFNGLEAWSEFRRNDYPPVPRSVNSGATPYARPVRLYYPQNEVAANPDNVAKQGTVNVYTGRIFWDVQ